MIDQHADFATDTFALEVHHQLLEIVGLTWQDLPFAAQVAQLALQSRSLDELEECATSLYRIALEHGHPFLPDLADRVLTWVEQRRPSAPASSESEGR